jgi:ATP-dependent Clp protease ATP-binding subunit ClpA
LPDPYLVSRRQIGHNRLHHFFTIRSAELQGHGAMATPDEPVADVFWPDGRVRLDLLQDSAAEVLQASLRLAQDTHWDRLRSPHVFMGLLATPDAGVRNWGERLGADLPKLLGQFQELFQQEAQSDERAVRLHREFLSDNVIRLLREAYNRASDNRRSQITSMDLLISLLTAPRSIVAECFEHIGITAAKLTELAVMAEQQGGQENKGP